MLQCNYCSLLKNRKKDRTFLTMVCAKFLVAVVPKDFSWKLKPVKIQDQSVLYLMSNPADLWKIFISKVLVFQLRVDAVGASFEMYVPLEIIVGTVPLRSTIRPIPQSPRHGSRSRGHHSTSSQATSHSEHYAGEIKNQTKETECRVKVPSCCWE